MLRVVFCDDQYEIIDQYQALLQRCAHNHGIEIELLRFYSGESLLFFLEDVPWEADILFLDIIMDKMDGIETARKLRRAGSRTQIIFLTGSEDYVYEAFDVDAVQYLIKAQVDELRFEKAFLKAVQRHAIQQEETFICEFEGIKQIIPVGAIAYFEIWKRVVTVYYADNQSAKFYASMDELTQRFAGKNFARAHRSYLVHLPYVIQFRPRSVLLKSGVVIPLGGTYIESFKQAFSRYVSQFHIYGVSGGKVCSEKS